MIFLTKKCMPLEIDNTTSDTTLPTRKVVNCLSIRLDFPGSNTTYCNQAKQAKAAKVSLLSGLMGNIGGPTQSRCRLIIAITDSILLYGNEVLADALKVDCRLRIL